MNTTCPNCAHKNEVTHCRACGTNLVPEAARSDADSVRLQRLVSLHARWLESADTMEKLADECDDLDETKDADECRERMRTFRECAGALDDILRAGMEANHD